MQENGGHEDGALPLALLGNAAPSEKKKQDVNSDLTRLVLEVGCPGSLVRVGGDRQGREALDLDREAEDGLSWEIRGRGALSPVGRAGGSRGLEGTLGDQRKMGRQEHGGEEARKDEAGV